MVIKKDPRAVLELLSQPVPVDEDTDFLDKLEKKVDFHDLPDKPAAPLDVDLAKKANEEQEAMLRDLNNAKINDVRLCSNDLNRVHYRLITKPCH